MTDKLCNVAVAVPLRSAFTYRMLWTYALAADLNSASRCRVSNRGPSVEIPIQNV